MEKCVNIVTGNPIVDEIAKLNITGNVIPETWYTTVTNSKGKVNSIALLILSDIVYWYRPLEIRDELSHSITYTKKFHAEDYLQRSYEQIADKFNISKVQAKNAILFLEELGVIKRHFKNLDTPYGVLANVLFIELVPSVLKELTFPSSEGGVYKNMHTPVYKNTDLPINNDTPVHKNVQTNTKNTTKTTTETTTTTKHTEADSVVVEDSKKIFRDLNLSDEEVKKILNAANYDIHKCSEAVSLLKRQTKKINNIVGWLLSAVEENYQTTSSAPSTQKNSFINCHQRNYDPSTLEHFLLSTRPT